MFPGTLLIKWIFFFLFTCKSEKGSKSTQMFLFYNLLKWKIRFLIISVIFIYYGSLEYLFWYHEFYIYGFLLNVSCPSSVFVFVFRFFCIWYFYSDSILWPFYMSYGYGTNFCSNTMLLNTFWLSSFIWFSVYPCYELNPCLLDLPHISNDGWLPNWNTCTVYQGVIIVL